MLTHGTLLQNRYRIVNLINKGGMGAVYQAKDEHLRCTVAVKEAGFVDKKLQIAFDHEAKLLAGLRHPALPKVTDHFIQNEKQYLVMDFIGGNDLNQMLEIRGEAFPLDQVLLWADQLLGVLEYLHRRKILHRDIKPANLKVTESGDLILLDFGLAKGQTTQCSLVTDSGGNSLRAYTPGYAPIEQVNGTGTDERSDLFSVGATLYHLLVGRPPVEALTRGIRLISGEPEGLIPLREINPDIPPEIEHLVLHSLALNRENRPSSASAMRAQLKLFGGNAVMGHKFWKSTNNHYPPTENQTIPAGFPPVQFRQSGENLIEVSTTVPILSPTHQLIPFGETDFVLIPAGSFEMGEDTCHEKPIHPVIISHPFFLGVYPVTQTQWKSVMVENPSHFKGGNHPVETVSWNAVQEFIRKLNEKNSEFIFRLPTEAEWEYACRAGIIGNHAENLDEIGWFKDNSEGKTHPVGLKRPNFWGLYDMLGNVGEWCQDRYGEYPNTSVTDPQGPNKGSGRVIRGGGWGYEAKRCSAAYRVKGSPDYCYHDLGFRLVRVVR